MVLRRRLRWGGRAAAAADAEDVVGGGIGNVHHKKPLGKIIVRFRPLLQDEVNRGETLCVMARGREVRLRPPHSETKKPARGKNRQMVTPMAPPEEIEFEVDRAMAPTSDHSEVYEAAAARLIDKAVAGGDGLLLLAGTPGSGRTHTLWGHPPTMGLFPIALAALARGWRGGSGTPFYASPPSPSTFAVRLCAAEVYGGEVRDLVRAAGRIRSSSENGRRRKISPSPQRTASGSSRWSLSARGLMSSIPSPSRRNRGSDGSGRGRRRRSSREGVAAPGSLVTSEVLVGVSDVTVDGVNEALQLIRHSITSRRKEGHLVLAAKLVANGDTELPRGHDAAKATGELVFVEIGDCPAGELPSILRTALARLKIQPSTVVATSSKSVSERDASFGPSMAERRSASCSSLHPAATGFRSSGSGTGTLPTGSSTTRSLLGNLHDSPLWALLDSLALNGASEPKLSRSTQPRAMTGTIAGASTRDSATVRRGQGNAGQLVVSIVATLRAGTGHYEEKKAVLETLAKSTRIRPGSNSSKALSLNRMLTIPAFKWRSQAGHSASTTSNAIPSAPPLSPRGSSGSSCSSTVSASSAKAAWGLPPADPDRALPHATQQLDGQRSPPPTPPKPAHLSAKSPAALAAAAVQDRAEFTASADRGLSANTFTSDSNLLRPRPQAEWSWWPLPGPPAPPPQQVVVFSRPAIASVGATFTHSETIATLLTPSARPSGGVPATWMERLPGIVERSPWTEGVRPGTAAIGSGKAGGGAAVSGKGHHRSRSTEQSSHTRRQEERRDGGSVRQTSQNESDDHHFSFAERSLGDGTRRSSSVRNRSTPSATFGGTTLVSSDDKSVAPRPSKPARRTAAEPRLATDVDNVVRANTDRQDCGAGEVNRLSAVSDWVWEGDGRPERENKRAPVNSRATRSNASQSDTIDLRDLTQDELIERLLQAERASRFWKNQHAHMAKQVENLIHEMSPRPEIPLLSARRKGVGTDGPRLYISLASDDGEGAGASVAGNPTGAPMDTQTKTESQSVEARLSGQEEKENHHIPHDGVTDKGVDGSSAESVSRQLVQGAGGYGGDEQVQESSLIDRRSSSVSPSNTPPGRADARRAIGGSKPSFEERRAVFAKDDPSIRSPSLPTQGHAFEAAGSTSLSSFSADSNGNPTLSVTANHANHVAQRVVQNGVPPRRPSDRDMYVSNGSMVSATSEGSVRTRNFHDPNTLEAPESTRSSPDVPGKLLPSTQTAGTGFASVDGSGGIIISGGSDPLISLLGISSTSSASATVTGNGNSHGAAWNIDDAFLGTLGSFSPPWVSPPTFRKPKAERRAREAQARAKRKAKKVEAKLAKARAIETRAMVGAQAPISVALAGAEQNATSLSTAGREEKPVVRNLTNGWDAGYGKRGLTKTRSEAQHQLREAAVDMNHSFLRGSSLKMEQKEGDKNSSSRALDGKQAIGGGLSGVIVDTQAVSGLETRTSQITSVASSVRPLPLTSSQTRPISSAEPPPLISERLGPTAPPVFLKPQPRPQVASSSQHPVSEPRGEDLVSGWKANALRQESAEPAKVGITAETEAAVSGSPWRASAIKQKALARRSTSPEKQQRQRPSSASLAKERADKQCVGSKGRGGRRRREDRRSSSPSFASRLSFGSRGRKGGSARSSRVDGSHESLASVAGLARGGSSAWKDRPPGIGPWPLLSRRVNNSTAGSSLVHHEETKEPSAIDPDDPTRLSICNIRPEHAAGLKDLREKLERKQKITRDRQHGKSRSRNSRDKSNWRGRGAPSEETGKSKNEERSLTQPWGNGSGFILSEERNDGVGVGGGRQSGFKLVTSSGW